MCVSDWEEDDDDERIIESVCEQIDRLELRLILCVCVCHIETLMWDSLLTEVEIHHSRDVQVKQMLVCTDRCLHLDFTSSLHNSMSLLSHLRSPALSFIQTLLSLLLSLVSLSSSHWFVGSQKVPKPLCSPTRRLRCTPVPGMSDSSAQFSWETGDDRFIFPTFHTGLWTTCEENIDTDTWGEKLFLMNAMTFCISGLYEGKFKNQFNFSLFLSLWIITCVAVRHNISCLGY